MPEEVLRLRATFVSDDMIKGLEGMRREIGMIPTHARQPLTQTQAYFAQLTKGIKETTNTALEFAPALRSVGLGAASAAGAMALFFKTITDTAARVVELKYRAQELGTTERDLRAWQLAASKVGIAPQQMMAGLTALKHNVEDFKFRIGGVRDELMAMGAGPVVARMAAARTEAEALKEAFDYKDALMAADPSGVKARRFFETIGLGAEAARLSFADFNKERDKLKPMSEADAASWKKFNDDLKDLGESFEELIKTMAGPLLPHLSQDIKDVEKLIGLLERVQEFAKSVEEDFKERWAHPENFPPPPGATTAIPRSAPGFSLPGVPGGYAPPQMQGGSDRITRTGLALVHEGESILPAGGAGYTGAGRAQFVLGVKEGVFQALVDFQGYVQAGGGGLIQRASLEAGAGGAGGGFGGGGGGGAGGGGGGGAGVPGAVSGPLTRPHMVGGRAVGPSATAAGRTRAERNLNPGNIKDSPWTRSQPGYAGVDEGGFAKFDTAEHGWAAMGNLLKTGKSYQGKTLGQVISTWSPASDPGNAPGSTSAYQQRVAKATGFDLNAPIPEGGFDAVAKAMAGVESGHPFGGGGGTAAAQGGEAVPSHILQKAQEVALQGGAPAVEKFMADQGYPKQGNWCGEFAASVVTAAGGQPPKDPQVASNWRNYGVGTTMPGAGDIAVAGRGVRTGATGSHVTIFEHLDPGGRTFTGLGGNQGAGFEGHFPVAGYSFRTAPTDRLDSQIAGGGSKGGVKAEGSVHITVNSNGTAAKTSTSTDGDLFQKTNVRSYKQMQPTSTPA